MSQAPQRRPYISRIASFASGEACCNAWNMLVEMTERITFLTRRA
jgi:hypothetical protein